MSLAHVKQLILDSYSPVDLIEKLEPWITTEEMLSAIEELLEANYTEAFDEELIQYYE